VGGRGESIVGPEWSTGVKRRDLFQQEVSVTDGGGAFLDDVLKILFVLVASGAGFQLVLIEPGAVDGQRASPSTQLMDSSYHKLH